MNLRDLQYLVAVVEEGHFGRAAHRCFVSQPTLSGQIAKLEEELGALLLERSTRSVRPTPLGLEVLQLAKQVVELSDRITQVAKAHNDPLHGPLELGAFPTMGPWWFPRLAPILGRELPTVRFFFHETKTPDLLRSLREGSLDGAFLADPDGAEFACAPIAFEPFFLLVPQAHVLAQESQVQLSQLRDLDLLLLEDGHCLRDQLLDLCRGVGIRVNSSYRGTGLETLRQTVRLGAGITLVPALAAQEQQQGLVTIPIVNPTPGRNISLRWRNTHPRAVALEAVAKVCANWAQEVGLGINP